MKKYATGSDTYMSDDEVISQGLSDIDKQETNIYRFKAGDLVTPYYAPAFDFYGIVVKVNPKEDRVYVDFNGTVRQMDPNEIRVILKQKLFDDYFERRGESLTASKKEAIYHCEPGRKYKVTTDENENNVRLCPKCRCDMHRENYKKVSPMFRCPECDFKISVEDLVKPDEFVDAKMVIGNEQEVVERVAESIMAGEKVGEIASDLVVDKETAEKVLVAMVDNNITSRDRLARINDMIDGDGIGELKSDDAWDSDWKDTVVAFVKKGISDDPTVIYDVNEDEFFCGYVDDWKFENEENYELK